MIHFCFVPPKLYKKTGDFSSPKGQYRFFLKLGIENQWITEKIYRFLSKKTAQKSHQNTQNFPVANGMGWIFGGYLFLLGNPLFLQCHSRRMASAFGIGNEHHINAFRQAFHIDFIAVFHGLHILS